MYVMYVLVHLLPGYCTTVVLVKYLFLIENIYTMYLILPVTPVRVNNQDASLPGYCILVQLYVLVAIDY